MFIPELFLVMRFPNMFTGIGAGLGTHKHMFLKCFAIVFGYVTLCIWVCPTQS